MWNIVMDHVLFHVGVTGDL